MKRVCEGVCGTGVEDGVVQGVAAENGPIRRTNDNPGSRYSIEA